MIFCIEIAPYVKYEYSSDSELFPYIAQSLNYSSFGLDMHYERNRISFESNFSYHLFEGINERPNKFNFFQGFGYIENNPGLSSNQFNYFLTAIDVKYTANQFNFFSGLSNPIWGPGINNIILSDKAPPFFNIGYEWKATDKFQEKYITYGSAKKICTRKISCLLRDLQ